MKYIKLQFAVLSRFQYGSLWFGFSCCPKMDQWNVGKLSISRIRNKKISWAYSMVLMLWLNPKIFCSTPEPVGTTISINEFFVKFWLTFNYSGKNNICIFFCFSLSQVGMLQYDDDGNLDQTSVIPLIDGGTEGNKPLLKYE